jgi:hypothetical protein
MNGSHPKTFIGSLLLLRSKEIILAQENSVIAKDKSKEWELFKKILQTVESIYCSTMIFKVGMYHTNVLCIFCVEMYGKFLLKSWAFRYLNRCDSSKTVY